MSDTAGQGPRVAVVIPAAGHGLRLGGQRKQFRLLEGRSILRRTIETFLQVPAVTRIVVAVPADGLSEAAEEVGSVKSNVPIEVVPGGTTRRESVSLALEGVPADVDVILVHDAVRPFVRPETIGAVIEAAAEHGAAAPGLPVTDTLREGTAEWFGSTASREGLFRMQTPQGFAASLLRRAYGAADDVGATDDVELVQLSGERVRIVPGDAGNIKITTEDDWRLATALAAFRTEDESKR
jgi:2-C-methyl-D-erythritol 4-phosphate cytidylyltransferase